MEIEIFKDRQLRKSLLFSITTQIRANENLIDVFLLQASKSKAICAEYLPKNAEEKANLPKILSQMLILLKFFFFLSDSLGIIFYLQLRIMEAELSRLRVKRWRIPKDKDGIESLVSITGSLVIFNEIIAELLLSQAELVAYGMHEVSCSILEQVENNRDIEELGLDKPTIRKLMNVFHIQLSSNVGIAQLLLGRSDCIRSGLFFRDIEIKNQFHSDRDLIELIESDNSGSDYVDYVTEYPWEDPWLRKIRERRKRIKFIDWKYFLKNLPPLKPLR